MNHRESFRKCYIRLVYAASGKTISDRAKGISIDDQATEVTRLAHDMSPRQVQDIRDVCSDEVPSPDDSLSSLNAQYSLLEKEHGEEKLRKVGQTIATFWDAGVLLPVGCRLYAKR
jgi:hypothetical protein